MSNSRQQRRERDLLIRTAHAGGASLRYLAAAFGLTPGRVHQICAGAKRPILRPVPMDTAPSLPSWLQKLSAPPPKG
jgi:hypothetical protein